MGYRAPREVFEKRCELPSSSAGEKLLPPIISQGHINNGIKIGSRGIVPFKIPPIVVAHIVKYQWLTEAYSEAYEKPILDQVNIVAGDLHGSLDFYRRLGVSLPEPPRDKPGQLFHANGDVEGGLHLDLDSSAFVQVWNKGWTGRQDLCWSDRVGV